MKNGFYKVGFRSNRQLLGQGIVIVRDGAVYGGDPQYIYQGTYSISGGRTTCHLDIIKHESDGQSVFGFLGDFSLDLGGVDSGDGKMLIAGSVRGQPQLRIEIEGRLIRAI